MSSENTLYVFLSEKHVGNLNKKENGELSFFYTDHYVACPNSVPLSISLPLQLLPFDHASTMSFFSGLLPDENIRQRLAKYLHVSDKNIFDLLKAIGGECAGAVSLHLEENVPYTIKKDYQYKILNEDDSLRILESIESIPFLAGEEDIRISAAGAQNKLMISFINKNIALPLKGTPSTHIIKPMIKGFKETVHNEFFIMNLAKLVGLPVPDAQIIWIKDVPFYVVERYDRTLDSFDNISRLQQEDFCQALKIVPEIKYENEGGPTLSKCFSLLDDRIKLGRMAGMNKIVLLKGIIFNFLVGNGDAHGKNFSILYKKEHEQLAPFYDLLSTVIYTDYKKSKMAMKIDEKYKFEDIFMRHFESLGDAIHMRKDFVRKQVMITAQSTLEKSSDLINQLNKNTKTKSEIYIKIYSIIEKHCNRFLK